MNVCIFIISAMLWWLITDRGFWALWDNIVTAAMVMLSWEAYYKQEQRSTIIITST